MKVYFSVKHHDPQPESAYKQSPVLSFTFSLIFLILLRYNKDLPGREPCFCDQGAMNWPGQVWTIWRRATRGSPTSTLIEGFTDLDVREFVLK